MSLPHAVVFDLDGTLIDSIPDVRAAVNVTLHAHRRPPLAQDSLRRMIGHGATAMLEWRSTRPEEGRPRGRPGALPGRLPRQSHGGDAHP